MLTYVTCSHCHAENLADERTCGSCGHDAQVCRLDCRCPQCRDSADDGDDDRDDE